MCSPYCLDYEQQTPWLFASLKHSGLCYDYANEEWSKGISNDLVLLPQDQDTLEWELLNSGIVESNARLSVTQLKLCKK